MPYPQIIVTGDSIAQGSFAVGGYGAKLAEEVCMIYYPRTIMTLQLTNSGLSSLRERRMSLIEEWEDGTLVNSYNT
jgi:hypothetical protein